ncbi:hypothetical protein PYW07_000221 [Mythimna separata]|uniref:Uncharacterized protein n=1 Tax=Mythimna separata TaxID=271217 RepID=A0AAD7Z3N0_MYTSE|nr:hypothetical protein PYW07_000221 [Mythimna separata]
MWNDGDPRRELRGHEVAMGRSSSEVVVLDDRVIEAANRAQPGVTNINVTRSSRLHIGPKFVSVTQNVDNTEVVKGRILGLELVSPQNSRRLRCSIAVFVCWAFVVASGLIFLILHFALATHPSRLNLDITDDWYLRRADWQAMPEYEIVNLNTPVPFVLIGHSAMEHCMDRYACIRNVLAIQSDHQRRGWVDIGPNFLVGGNGLIFEGRGANVQGVMVRSWNTIGVSVMFLGDYMTAVPSQVQFDHVNVLLSELVRVGVLRSDYIIYGHCQVQGAVKTPGINLMRQLSHFEHWNSTNASVCIGWNK